MFIMPKINLNVITNDYKRRVLSELMDKEGCLVIKPNSNARSDIKYYHHIILKNLYSNKQWVTPIPGAWYMPHIDKETLEKYNNFSLLFDLSVANMIAAGVFTGGIDD